MQLLGEGTHSSVKLANPKKSDEEVAMYLIPQMGLAKEVKELQGRVKLLMDLDHPNVMRVTGYYESDIYPIPYSPHVQLTHSMILQLRCLRLE